MGLVASIGYTIYKDICKVHMHSLGIFEPTGRSKTHRYECLLPRRCTPVGLCFKGLDMALYWGLIESNGDALGGYM